MNGSEAFARPQQTDPRLMFNTQSELTDSEKMDLMAGDQAPYARALDKLMKLVIVKARNAAMECDPTEEKRQTKLMTVAHAKNEFYEELRSQINFEKANHLADVRLKAAQEDLQDQETIEAIILDQR